jgi:hypothetical protein
MRWLLLAAVCGLLASQTGCHHSWPTPLPMQNVNRVPPPGTGSYPMQGGYYNSPMGMQSSVQPSGDPAVQTAAFAASAAPESGPMAVSQAQAVPQAGMTQAGMTQTGVPQAGMTQAGVSQAGAMASQPVAEYANQFNDGSSVTLPTGFPSGGATGSQYPTSPVTQASFSDSGPGLQWQQ